MSTLKSLTVSVILLAGIAAPALALAQSAPTPWWCAPQFASWWGIQGCNTNMGGAGLLVYVQTTNQNQFYGQNRQPSDFTVAVSGQQPIPPNFQGSISGTPVLIGSGSYNVTVVNPDTYTASYSTGCSGSIGAGDHALCVITMSSYSGYSQNPIPYNCNAGGYPYNSCVQQTLTCSPAYQTTSTGGTATFEARGGIGTYSWTTPSRTYLNIGPVLNVVLPSNGLQSVTVSSGGATAVCSVNVVGGYQGYLAPSTPSYTVSTPGYTTPYIQPYVSKTYYPSVPNTGFEPIAWMNILLALAALLGAFIAFPYVRAAVATSFR